MRKQNGKYVQYEPNVTIENESIPAIKIDESFKYLGRHFNFRMDKAEIKTSVKTRLIEYLRITSQLEISVQQRLKILKTYIPAQFAFELRTYDFSFTWIEQTPR